MTRKRTNSKSVLKHSPIHFREKRKWQIALRRYVLEKQKSISYAPYFALEITKFREWIELQFDEEANWDSFSMIWQFDHVMPISYFDFTNENDLRLCWNFSNIRVAKTDKAGNTSNRIDVLAAKQYFDSLYQSSGYHICAEMVKKIETIEKLQVNNKPLEDFIIHHKGYLDSSQKFTTYDFERLNNGINIKILVSEKEFLKRFGD